LTSLHFKFTWSIFFRQLTGFSCQKGNMLIWFLGLSLFFHWFLTRVTNFMRGCHRSLGLHISYFDFSLLFVRPIQLFPLKWFLNMLSNNISVIFNFFLRLSSGRIVFFSISRRCYIACFWRFSQSSLRWFHIRIFFSFS